MTDAPRPRLSLGPGLAGEAEAGTASPARGAEMRNFLQARLLQKNRAPPLVHSWDFWHDRQDRAQQQPSSSSPGADGPESKYEDRLVCLAPVSDVRAFWNVFNNFDVMKLPLRDSVHLFHKGVKPVWEDPRNAQGGSWTFRVPKQHASEFWKEVCMMAIGEQLQEAVESERTTFRDDICGVSLGVRFNSCLVQIWNRDGAHEQGIQRLLDTLTSNLSEQLQPREGSYYYKKHSEHSGFAGESSIPDKKGMGSNVGGRDAATAPQQSDASTNKQVMDKARVAVQGMKNANEDMRSSMDDMDKRLGIGG